MNEALFTVIRRCDADLCEPGCNCDRCPVVVDVDELTDGEVARFTASGTAAQRAELAAYLAPIAKEIPAMKSIKPLVSADGYTAAPACSCSECRAARLPVACPPGCPCLVCLVDGLSANPAPRRAA